MVDTGSNGGTVGDSDRKQACRSGGTGTGWLAWQRMDRARDSMEMLDGRKASKDDNGKDSEDGSGIGRARKRERERVMGAKRLSPDAVYLLY